MSIFDLFKSFNWGDKIIIDEFHGFIMVVGTGKYILKKERKFYMLNFYKFEKGEIVENSYGYKFYFPISLDVNIVLNTWADKSGVGGYNLTKNISILRKIIPNNVKIIKISESYKNDYKIKCNEIRVKPDFYKNLIKRVNDIGAQSYASKGRLETYLINKEKFSLFNVSTKPTTTISKGDFTFFIDRFNLSTKKDNKDFKRYLSNDDIINLGEFFNLMLKKQVFPKEYFKRINDYFVKEKLKEIINKGYKLLELGGIKSKKDQEIIDYVFPGEKMEQLETVWQRFFEKYLLYLFFSYKYILPKIEFKNIESGEKKYPDFIGINHYDGVDIIEIKTHLKPILTYDKSHDNFGFSSDASKAVIQTINYMDGLVSKDFRKTKDQIDILSKLNVADNLYRPKGIIILSSKGKIVNNFDKLNIKQKDLLNRDFIKLRNSLNNIQIFTFDEILEIADNYIENIIK